MAEKRLVGHDATSMITLTGHNFISFGLDLVVSQIVAETTADTDSWVTRRGGLLDHSATVTAGARFDAATTAPAITSLGDPVAVTYPLAAGCSYGGNGLVESVTISRGKRDNAHSLDFSVLGSGALTETWDESA